ncbi:TetR/AcrR family transcriptional regulator [Svornostia abyssi]|uniref:TetR/AcrR family transcriptional regulator n=1 Tax=Svornostia abyssi TaxID=2898438 RepID=A0ABY5PGR4_9ACTN|nr:TetR/AcrR family transcriptional regulator [Parviterribacteraceae bacterium J379]
MTALPPLVARALDPRDVVPDDPASERILDAALELAAASGLRHLTMEDVARAAGVGRATVYRRFGDREALVDALSTREARRCLAELAVASDPSAPVVDQFAEGFVVSIGLLRSHPLLRRLVLVERQTLLQALDDGLFELARGFLAKRIRVAQRLGEVRDVDADQAAEILTRVTTSFALLPATSLDLDDPERLRAVARELLAPVLFG